MYTDLGELLIASTELNRKVAELEGKLIVNQNTMEIDPAKVRKRVMAIHDACEHGRDKILQVIGEYDRGEFKRE